MSKLLNIFTDVDPAQGTIDATPVERACVKKCKEKGVSCPVSSCRSWIEYEEDLNCTHVTVDKHEGGLTLREIGERLGISFVRVCQIEKSAIEKLAKRIEKPVSIK
jgi:hypothetical protein